MKVLFDGREADITFEDEKTLGDVLKAVECWAESGGMSIYALRLDGEQIDAPGLEEVFPRSIDSVSTLDIHFDRLLRPELNLEELAQRLEDLPLDIQLGNDAEAAQTISRFSAAAEQLIRLFQAKGETETLDDFTGVLKQLLDASAEGDMVLLGDLAEYEIAPRIRSFIAKVEG
jgi:hypothetical protein